MIYPTLWRNSAPSLWDDMFTVRREFDRLFDRYAQRSPGETLSAWTPVVDVHETPEEITVSAELPGLDPEDVNVTVQNGILAISGEKQEEQDGSTPENVHILERRYGRFERSFSLPRTVVADDVKAEFRNGVLTIRLPKTEQAKPRRIEVGTSSVARKQEIRAGERKQRVGEGAGAGQAQGQDAGMVKSNR